ncbi:MAG: hypothetical protein ABJL72_04270 [Roseobacter sp.]
MKLLDGYNFASRGLLIKGHGLNDQASTRILISGLSSNDFYTNFALDGQLLTAVPSAPLDSQNWQVNGVDIPGATDLTYRPALGVDGVADTDAIRLRGVLGGQAFFSFSYILRRPAPVFTGYEPVEEIAADGPFQVALATGFTGAGLSFESSEAWAEVVSGNLSLAAELRSGTIIVTASNSGGSASGSMQINLTERPNATLYVATTGDDATGDGTAGNPLATVNAALALAIPGDTVDVADGVYSDPIVVDRSGTVDLPITLNLNNAVFRGDLQSHVALGGDGNIASGNSMRDGLYLQGQSHIVIVGGVFEDWWRSGLFVIGEPSLDLPQVYGVMTDSITLRGQTVRRTGAAGIYGQGMNSDNVLPLIQTTPLTTNITVEDFHITETNIPNDRILNPNVEALSFAAGVSGIIVRRGYIGNTRQYGIDFKAGVDGFTCHDVEIDGAELYGVYCDAARRWVRNGLIYNIKISNCKSGVVLAREAGPASFKDDPRGWYTAAVADLGAEEFIQELHNIRIWNIEMSEIAEAAVYFHNYPGDGPHGAISNIYVYGSSIHNAGRSGNDLNLFGWDTLGITPTNINFVGNVIWNDEGNVRNAQGFGAIPAWLNFSDNFYTGDPLFVDAAASPPDLRVLDTSYVVDALTTIPAGFEDDIAGIARALPTTAGANSVAVPSIAQDVWSSAATPGVSATLTASRTDFMVAPDAAHFALEFAGFHNNTPADETADDPSYREMQVFWDFGEDYTFTAADRITALDAQDGGNRTAARFQTGPSGSCVWRTAGQKTVRWMVYEPPSTTHPNGAWAQGSQTFDVIDPDVFFAAPTGATFYVHPSGGGTPPVGATTYTSLDAALDNHRLATLPTRVMLAQGETFSMSNHDNRPPNAPQDVAFWLVAEDGASAINRPVVTASGTSGTLLTDSGQIDATDDIRAKSGLVIQGIDFVGPYDPTTGLGGNVKFLNARGGFANKHKAIDDCTFAGFFSGVESNSEGPDQTGFTLTFNNTKITGWGNVGFFGAQDHLVHMKGTEIHQLPAARMVLAGTTSLGPVRCDRVLRGNLWASSLFSSSGYSAFNSQLAVQPGLRWFGNTDASTKGRRSHLGACVIESARKTLRISPSISGAERYPLNILVHGCVVIAGSQASEVVDLSFAGVRMQDNVFIHTSNTRNTAPQAFVVLSVAQSPDDGSNLARPIEIINNTCINLTGTAAPVLDNNLGTTLDVTVNNLLHQPALALPDTPHAPLDVAATIDMIDIGYTDENGVLSAEFAPSANDGQLLRPAPGSSAINAATGAAISASAFTPDYTVIISEARDLGALQSE